MAIYEQLEKLDDGYFFEGCKARVRLARWLMVFLFIVLVVLAPVSFGVLSLLVGMSGTGLAFELDEARAKPDPYERLLAENKKLKEQIKNLKNPRIRNVTRAFGRKET